LAWIRFQPNYRRLQIWRDALAAQGAAVVEESTSGLRRNLRLKAQAGPLEVRFDAEEGPRVVVGLPGPPGILHVYIRRQEGKPWGTHETKVGHGRFDRTFYVLGPLLLRSALLDAETRRLLLKLNAECSFELAYGELRADMVDEKIPDLLPLLLDLGQRIIQPWDVAQRLAENAQKDPETEVRLGNLLLLAREFPGEPGTTGALRTACADGSLQIRLQAAKKLGAEGREVLAELAASPLNDDVSAEAVSFLGGDLPIERARTILVQALSRRHVRTACAGLKTLGGSTAAEDIETLAAVMAREKGELAVAAAAALGTTGSPAVERPLLLAMQHEEKDLRLAAAKALGRVGTEAAVMPLKEAAEGSLPYTSFRRAARQAVAEIQSRLPGASPGQLSLTEDEAGRLSLASDLAGQLSLPADEPGQLSFSGGGENL
jgi:HEAT repeat protein